MRARLPRRSCSADIAHAVRLAPQMDRACRLEWDSSRENKDGTLGGWTYGRAHGSFVDVPTLHSCVSMLSASTKTALTQDGTKHDVPKHIVFVDVSEHVPLERALSATGSWQNAKRVYDPRRGSGTYFVSALQDYLYNVRRKLGPGVEAAACFVVFPDVDAHRRSYTMAVKAIGDIPHEQ
eukprot:3984136-Pleurochrysis_carterae.AAC.1